jgi:hypothetical protein
MKVSGQLHAHAALPSRGNRPWNSFYRRVGGSQSRSERNGEEEIYYYYYYYYYYLCSSYQTVFETFYEFITCIFSEIVNLKYLSRTKIYTAGLTEKLSMENIECIKGNFSGIFKY